MSSVSTFIELFSLAPGTMAPTGAPPNQRLPILIEALRSGSARQQRLALMACEAALNTGQQYRTLDPGPIGLRVSPPLWSPSTWGEIYDAYREIWLLVRDHVDRLMGDEQQAAGMSPVKCVSRGGWLSS